MYVIHMQLYGPIDTVLIVFNHRYLAHAAGQSSYDD